MDWTTPLRSQQADFGQRLQLNQLLPLQIPGLYGECKQFSAREIQAWQATEDFTQSLGRKVLKVYLDNSITKVKGDRLVDFRITRHLDWGLRVKVVSGNPNLDSVQWSVTAQECDRNVAIVFMIYPDRIHSQAESAVIFAGFLPTNLLKRHQTEGFVGIQDLLYGGGLKSYLESLPHTQPQKIDLQETASLSNWLPYLHPRDLQKASEVTWKQEFIQWVQSLALNATTDVLRLYLYDLLNTQYYRQTLWQLYYKRTQAIAALTESQHLQEAIAHHDAKAERVMLELAGVSGTTQADAVATKSSTST
ncbi:MAG: hypothetical protein SAJ12_19320 [Jaaginema sp. PMC 1079.18]|nr:hypothetical protein [Jaaginema sp. PMC 1080.18]MEC4853138.1 hypothetical protein [Jaaginema sp. PMC 1079.18]MEC4864980.1 hypothetical protein [Jaaginema sp. PMC 1078.18]